MSQVPVKFRGLLQTGDGLLWRDFAAAGHGPGQFEKIAAASVLQTKAHAAGILLIKDLEGLTVTTEEGKIKGLLQTKEKATGLLGNHARFSSQQNRSIKAVRQNGRRDTRCAALPKLRRLGKKGFWR